MTQNPESGAFVPWGTPSSAAPDPWWNPFMTPTALLAHITVMLVVTSVLALINLMLNPAVWWSLAILVVWLVFIVIHAVGLLAARLLAEEDASSAWSASQDASERQDPARPGWQDVNDPRHHEEAQDTVTSEVTTETWTAAGRSRRSWPQSTSGSQADGDEDSANSGAGATDTGESERVPWRAATDIAWLRRRHDGEGDGKGSGEASS